VSPVVKFLPIAALIGAAVGAGFIILSLLGVGGGTVRPWHVGIVAAIISYAVFWRQSRNKLP
jgi:hypothetical protein